MKALLNGAGATPRRRLGGRSFYLGACLPVYSGAAVHCFTVASPILSFFVLVVCTGRSRVGLRVGRIVVLPSSMKLFAVVCNMVNGSWASGQRGGQQGAAAADGLCSINVPRRRISYLSLRCLRCRACGQALRCAACVFKLGVFCRQCCRAACAKARSRRLRGQADALPAPCLPDSGVTCLSPAGGLHSRSLSPRAKHQQRAAPAFPATCLLPPAAPHPHLYRTALLFATPDGQHITPLHCTAPACLPRIPDAVPFLRTAALPLPYAAGRADPRVVSAFNAFLWSVPARLGITITLPSNCFHDAVWRDALHFTRSAAAANTACCAAGLHRHAAPSAPWRLVSSVDTGCSSVRSLTAVHAHAHELPRCCHCNAPPWLMTDTFCIPCRAHSGL